MACVVRKVPMMAIMVGVIMLAMLICFFMNVYRRSNLFCALMYVKYKIMFGNMYMKLYD